MRQSRHSLRLSSSGVEDSSSGLDLVCIQKTTRPPELLDITGNTETEDVDVPLITPTRLTRFFDRLHPTRHRRRRSSKKSTVDVGEGLLSPRTETSISPSSASGRSLGSVPCVTPTAADSFDLSDRGDKNDNELDGLEQKLQQQQPKNKHPVMSSVFKKVHPMAEKGSEMQIQTHKARSVGKPQASHGSSNGSESSILKNLRLLIHKSTKVSSDDTNKPPRRGLKKVRIKEAHLLETKSTQSVPVQEISTSPEEMIKIFLLLLEPHAKIFELIQLHYPVSITTIGDIIGMIPCNATEQALGSQKYIGICRPKRRAAEITDLSLFASNPTAPNSVGISHSDIFVAIPEGFTAQHVVSFSKQILSNPRIQRLLEKSTSPASRKRKSRQQKESTSSRTIMDVVQEEEPSSSSFDPVQRNASVGGERDMAASPKAARASDLMHTSWDTEQTSFANSQTSYSSPMSYANRAILGGNYDEDKSLQGSYTSWSRSFNSSVASMRRRRVSSPAVLKITAPVSTPTPRLRRVKDKFTMGVFAAITFFYMLLRYCLDSNHLPQGHVGSEPLGATGLVQCSYCLILLITLQRLILVGGGSSATDGPKCPYLNRSPGGSRLSKRSSSSYNRSIELRT